MHDTALDIGSKFITLYALPTPFTIVELGSYDVNGTLRGSQPVHAVYLGLDVEHGPGVDLVVTPGEPIPLRNEFADLVITSSQMEHDPCFWASFLELTRILKPGGTLYFSAPSNGNYHAYPLDVWRFYPDAGLALAQWAARNGTMLTLIESFTAERNRDVWNDFVAVFRKGEVDAGAEVALLSDLFACTNVRTYRSPDVSKREDLTEDGRITQRLRVRIADLETALLDSQHQVRDTEAFRASLEQELRTAREALTENGRSIEQLRSRVASLESELVESQHHVRELKGLRGSSEDERPAAHEEVPRSTAEPETEGKAASSEKP